MLQCAGVAFNGSRIIQCDASQPACVGIFITLFYRQGHGGSERLHDWPKPGILVGVSDKVCTRVGLALTYSKTAFLQKSEGGGREGWCAGQRGCRGVEEGGFGGTAD